MEPDAAPAAAPAAAPGAATRVLHPRKRAVDDKAAQYYSFKCSDGRVVIPHDELHALCEKGHALTGLIFGYQGGIGTPHEPNLDLFSEFPMEELNLLRFCVRTAALPKDNIAARLEKNGRLRQFADTFGGFDVVDQVLQKEYELREAEQRNRFRCATKPSEDVGNLFDWYAIQGMGPGGVQFENLQERGYELAGIELGTPLSTYHFRRARLSRGSSVAD